MTDYTKAFDGIGPQYQIDEAQRIAAKLPSEATITDGVMRWNSNNAVPFDDVVALAVHIGLPVDAAACTKARDASNAVFLKAYRKRPRSDSAEAQLSLSVGRRLGLVRRSLT